MLQFNSPVVIESSWTLFKANTALKVLSNQYVDDIAYGVGDPTLYTIFAFDGPAVYVARIWKGTVPAEIVAAGYSQATNDADETDWETNYKPYANQALSVTDFDPRILKRFGNLTAASVSDVLVSARAYNEQASEAQRSVKSSSANDANPSGSGAKEVRLTYLNSNYVLKTEDILLNGTTAVATVATDIRFVESFKVIKGAAAAGAIELWTANNGTGTAICGIGTATEDAFMCHHYVPAGMRAWIRSWEVTADDEVSLKLQGQTRYGANLVDENWDLEKLFNGNLTPPQRLNFPGRTLLRCAGEKTYIRIKVVPNQVTSTVIRARLAIFEDKAP